MFEKLRNGWIQFVRRIIFDSDPEDIDNWTEFDKYNWRNKTN